MSATTNAPGTTTFTHREAKRVVLGLLVAIFLGGLEQTIVAVALPLMSADLSGVNIWLGSFQAI